MARVNSLLSIVVDQGANELRLASDREPKMFALGAPRRLSIPAMTDDTVRAFLGEILADETASALAEQGRAEVRYEAEGIGTFHVALARHGEQGVSAVFLRAGSAAPRATNAAVATPSSNAPAAERAESVPSVEPALGAEPAPHPSPRALPHAELAALVARAASMRASDLHLTDGESPTVRIDGVLRKLADVPFRDVATVLGLGGGTVTRSLDLAYDIMDTGRVRVHVFNTADGLAAAIRLLPPSAPSFASLDMPVPFDDVVSLPHGLVLVCGATGSGKSTTLAALAQEALRRRSIVLVTLEDPIEYKLVPQARSLVRRRQVGRDVSDFASGLRDALREDPDVLLVGEMRDAETISLALTAAETGHLVLASIHSRGAAAAVERIVDACSPERQGQVRAQLAESLRVVVGQRLLPRARGTGRIPAVEILRVSRGVASLIREGKTAQIPSAIQAGRKDGCISLERSLADRVKSGEVRLEDARAAANDLDALSSYLSG
jgi:twitching motility protein PilT